MRFWWVFSILMMGWVLPLRGQCLLPAEFYSGLPEWSDPRDVTDFVAMVGPTPWWEGIVAGTPQAILDDPVETDLGNSPEGEDFLFSIVHTANACVTTSVSGIPSSGTLSIEGSEFSGWYTETVHYRFTPSVTGDVFFDFLLEDATNAVLRQATLRLSVLPSYTLTVDRGPGVLGSPSTTDSYVENTSVPYAYSPDTCYAQLAVAVDAVPVASAGTVIMDDDHALNATASFIVYQIAVDSTAGGHTDRDGTNPVDCGGSLTIAPIPDACYAFSHWSGDASGSDDPLILNDISESLSITANFTQQIFTVTVNAATGGHTDHDGSNAVPCGDDFTVEAFPDTGYEFSGWTGDVTSNENPLTLHDVTQDYDITPNFSAISTIDLFVSRFEVIQGITMLPTYRVHIADRPAVVRVFVGVTGAPSIANVTGRLTRYVGGAPGDSITEGPITAPASPSEGNLNQTLNFELPSHWLSAGTSYVLELDPDNAIAEMNEANNRRPASGSQSFEFQVVEDLDIVVVPIRYTNAQSITTQPSTSPFPMPYLTWFPPKVYPVSTINYTLHAVHDFIGNLKLEAGWHAMLNDVTAIHNAEDPGWTKQYYGVVNFFDNDGCAGGCIAGLGWIGQPTAVGFSGWGTGTNEASETMVHEMGHNFGRYHAPCGGAGSLDPAFPYAGGKIGQWGLDVATMNLKNPNTYVDYMSYCDPDWTSDYTYRAIYLFRQSHTWKAATIPAFQDTLYVGGSIAQDGSVHLLPVYRQLAPIDDTTSGSHRLVLKDADGAILAVHAFTPTPIGDSDGATGFALRLPYEEGIATLELYQDSKLLLRREAEGPAPDVADVAVHTDQAGDLALSWNPHTIRQNLSYRIRFSRDDGKTWKVLALRQKATRIDVAASAWQDAPTPRIEIQAVDGVRTATRIVALP